MIGRTALVLGVTTLLFLASGWLRRDSGSARISAHLTRVGEELRAAPPTGLNEEQRRLREETLDWLDEYRLAGVFPHNHVRMGERVPVFVDPHGTPCAVGYLLLRSGESALVEAVVRADNLVRVPELEGEPRLNSWLYERGLTLDEAALIQPAYGGFDPIPEPESAHYEEGTVGATIVTAAIASYVAMSSSEPGQFGWVDAAALGAVGVHSYLMLGERQDGAPAWADIANVAGIVANGIVVTLRALAPGSAEVSVGSARIHPYVAPGINGTQLGLTIR